MESISELLQQIRRECPLIPYTHAGRLSSIVRRMRREKELNIPIAYRTSAVISVEHGLPANELSEAQWESLFAGLCLELQTSYPSISQSITPNEGE